MDLYCYCTALLLEKGMFVDGRIEGEFTALMQAVWHGYEVSLSLSLSRSLILSPPYRLSPLSSLSSLALQSLSSLVLSLSHLPKHIALSQCYSHLSSLFRG